MTWTKIETLPTEDGLYIVYAPSLDPEKPLIRMAWYSPGFGWSGLPKPWLDAITHWMELPEAPE